MRRRNDPYRGWFTLSAGVREGFLGADNWGQMSSRDAGIKMSSVGITGMGKFVDDRVSILVLLAHSRFGMKSRAYDWWRR